MVMEYGAAAILSGLVGYAIGKDGKLQPVSQEAINRLLRDTKPEFITKVDIDTSIARDGNESSGCYPIAGSFILVLNPATPTDKVYIKLNEPGWPPLPLTSLRRVVGPFYRFFIKNAAGVGTLNLVITRGYQFQMIEKEDVGTYSMKLIQLDDVNILAPGDKYIVYWDNATQRWLCQAITGFAHKAIHQDGGTDEMSLVGLDGEPSTLTTHKAVISGAVTLGHVIVEAASDIDVDVDGKVTLGGHKTRHQDGGNDEISITGLDGSPAQKAAASGLASLNASSLVVQKPADRLSKANFEITANKLLLGAGVGADPTEIDPPGAQIFEKLITSAANAGDVLVATVTTQPCQIESIVIHANAAQTANMTSCGVFGGAGKVITFISATDAVQGNLNAADKQVAWTGAVRLAATKTIVISLVGTGATAVDLTIVIKYRASVSGGYLV